MCHLDIGYFTECTQPDNHAKIISVYCTKQVCTFRNTNPNHKHWPSVHRDLRQECPKFPCLLAKVTSLRGSTRVVIEWLACYRHPLYEPHIKLFFSPGEEHLAADAAWEEEQRRSQYEIWELATRRTKKKRDLSPTSVAFLECERLWAEDLKGWSDTSV